eukprot:GHVN01097045.1.p1 GENE.GHVN01097045.1~~GHVN01097045.1.p1  ORF type:complete len:410 (-),score=52.67 GHVN01097045.1:1304-2533(-)
MRDMMEYYTLATVALTVNSPGVSTELLNRRMFIKELSRLCWQTTGPSRVEAVWTLFRLIRSSTLEEYNMLLMDPSNPFGRLCDSVDASKQSRFGRVEGALAIAAIIIGAPKAPRVQLLKLMHTDKCVAYICDCFSLVADPECRGEIERRMTQLSDGLPMVQYLKQMLRASELLIKWGVLIFIKDRKFTPVDFKSHTAPIHEAGDWCGREHLHQVMHDDSHNSSECTSNSTFGSTINLKGSVSSASISLQRASLSKVGSISKRQLSTTSSNSTDWGEEDASGEPSVASSGDKAETLLEMKKAISTFLKTQFQQELGQFTLSRQSSRVADSDSRQLGSGELSYNDLKKRHEQMKEARRKEKVQQRWQNTKNKLLTKLKFGGASGLADISTEAKPKESLESDSPSTESQIGA